MIILIAIVAVGKQIIIMAVSAYTYSDLGYSDSGYSDPELL